MRKTFLAALVASMALASTALAHDIYGGVKHPKNGFPCCGGVGPDADCEPLELDQIEIKRDTIRVFSKRWNAWVRIAEESVLWTALPTDPLVRPGHVCLRPRTSFKFFPAPTAGDPDPVYRVFCIFLLPGGS